MPRTRCRAARSRLREGENRGIGGDRHEPEASPTEELPRSARALPSADEHRSSGRGSVAAIRPRLIVSVPPQPHRPWRPHVAVDRTRLPAPAPTARPGDTAAPRRSSRSRPARPCFSAGGAAPTRFWRHADRVDRGDREFREPRPVARHGSWSLKGVLGQATSVSNLTNVKIVPGDVLTLTQPVTVTLVGDTLAADLAVTPGRQLRHGSRSPLREGRCEHHRPGRADGDQHHIAVTPATAGTLTATVTVPSIRRPPTSWRREHPR